MANDQGANCSLISAVNAGNLQRVRELIIAIGLSYSQAWSDGYVLLRNAVKNRYTDVAKLLLTTGSNVNSKNEKPTNTPLHFAVINCDIEIVEMLVARCAKIDAKNKTGLTPLHIAAQNGKVKTVKILLNYGAGVDSKNEYDKTPLHIATKRSYLKVVSVLLKFCADINSQDVNGNTALHIAALEEHVPIFEVLLEHGADINIVNKHNRTPPDLATCRARYFGGNSSCQIIAENIKRQIVKMKNANLYVSEQNLQSISNNDELSVPVNECQQEIAKMKSEKISNSTVSFYDILTKDISQLAMYARNESIVQICKSGDHKNKFPIYASIINSSFRKGERRKNLLEQGNETFDLIKPRLPYLCAKKIFSYLSDEDLRNLIDAKNFN
jgi:hypothetical protein